MSQLFVVLRFREFMTLHTKLCAQPLLRHALRGIPGPNKWRHLPLNKLDDATVSARRAFLEKYLQSLLQRVEINSSALMREFLAYGYNTPITFAGKPVGVSLPRLDKFWGRTVSGVFQTLRSTLPISEGEVCSMKRDSLTSVGSQSSTLLPSPSSEVPFILPVASANCQPSAADSALSAVFAYDQSPISSPNSPILVSFPPNISQNGRRGASSPGFEKYELFLAVTAEVQVS